MSAQKGKNKLKKPRKRRVKRKVEPSRQRAGNAGKRRLKGEEERVFGGGGFGGPLFWKDTVKKGRLQ